MIKEWCEECEGVGEVQNVGFRERINEIFECPNCQGKGWVPLEPEYKKDGYAVHVESRDDSFMGGQTIWASTREPIIEVYIKEVKEDTK